jgi:glycosyltransferase involved in cell wall biosynthesis
VKELREKTEGARSRPLANARVLVLFGGGRLFGQERGNLEVFRSLAQLGLQARFITSSRFGPSEIQTELDRLGFEWATAPFGYHWGRYLFGRYFYYIFFNVYGVLATSWRLLREARRWKPTHLYIMNWMFYTYAAPAIWLLNLPLIYRAGDELPLHTTFHRLVTRSLLRRIDSMVCISKQIREHCIQAGMPKNRTKVIYNYPPQRAVLPAPSQPKIPEGAVVVTYVGQISKRKGVEVLIEAVGRMIKGGRNLVLWVIGEPAWDDGFLDEMKRRTTEAGLSKRICFFGYVQNVLSILERSDIHVCPSLEIEALSNVVLEAKLCGKPSVVFPTGGLPELIEHEVDGYICREQTVEALVEGIEFFLRDEARRCAAGLAAKESLEQKFGLRRFRAAWSEVFAETLVKDEKQYA